MTFAFDPRFPKNPNKTTWPWQPGQPVANVGEELPHISIITPSFNQGKFIEETIRSVLLQDYPNLQYIIIDGGSSDETVAIIKKYEPWISYWVSEPDRGQSHAINKGLALASGDWVAWLNSDDVYLPGALSTIGRAAVETDCAWLVGKTVMTDERLQQIGIFNPEMYTALGRDPRYQPQGWLDFVCTKRAGISLPQPSSFWRREAVLSAGGVDETIHYVMDHELYGRLAHLGLRPILLDSPLACFRSHPAQKTADFPVSFWREELSIVNRWLVRVDARERKKLSDYATWLERYIDQYKYRKLWPGFKSFVKKVIGYRR